MIREATLDDMDLIVEGFEETRREEHYEDPSFTEEDRVQNTKAIERGWVRVVEVDGKPVGFTKFELGKELMFVEDEFLWLSLTYIKEEYRQKGLARQLHEEMARIAARHNLKWIYCDVFDVNKASVVAHERLDYAPVYTIYKKEV